MDERLWQEQVLVGIAAVSLALANIPPDVADNSSLMESDPRYSAQLCTCSIMRCLSETWTVVTENINLYYVIT